MKTITKHATFTKLHSNTQNMIDSTQKFKNLISLHSHKKFKKIVNRETSKKSSHLLILEAFQQSGERKRRNLTFYSRVAHNISSGNSLPLPYKIGI